ncbi:hypothetical protein GGQ68_004766 [Sagittula marina]|uniref:Hemolysin-type calcium-binding repeat-containing protein n=1 Tax=Sagittula marina TaxID=943940 RepID=A0A7W6DZY0_9RHOB|nr:calcium-binding protein [Sagittula marina]MBB3988409.1 hypothetical protein [Sagittula marina]
MAHYDVSLVNMQGTGHTVQDDHFAVNALQAVNIDARGGIGPTDGFVSAIETLGIDHVRYPGGGTENVIDITKLQNGEIREEVTRFFDWARTGGADGGPVKVTMVLPTKTDLPAEQIQAFLELALAEYGDLIEGLEIGNEYSIGRYRANYDRSTHPEENPNGDFVSSMNEEEYGIAANRVINASVSAIEALAARGIDADPAILIQIGEPQGAASSFKRTGTFEDANRAILAELDRRALDAIDGGVAHYYYNQGHEEGPVFTHEWYEHRSLDYRIENFSELLGRDVGLYITEWNVLASNYNQLGAASSGVLLEMFEFMVQAGVQDAFVWPLQHRTGSNIAGNRQVDEIDLTIGGTAFQMMSESLRPEESVTGRVTSFESISSDSTGSDGKVEVNVFSSAYQDVLFVSLRDLDRATVDLDISRFTNGATDIRVEQVTIDQSSSDGLSDMADAEGLNRIGRRVITEEEAEQLATLAFFDPDDQSHIRDMAGGVYQTYLPTFDSIIPLVSNPRSIEDYYFATETDVDALILEQEGDFFTDGMVSLDLLPYDFVRIVIDKVDVQKGGNGTDALKGGTGADRLIGYHGDDRLHGGEGNDTLKGGHGDDLMVGGDGDDVIVAGDGEDTMFGGDGADTFVLTSGNATVNGGEGKDTVHLKDDASQDVTFAYLDGQLAIFTGDEVVTLDSVERIRFEDRTIDTEDAQITLLISAQAASSDASPPPDPDDGLL